MWKDLSLKEKAAFMLVAVNNGIYDLQDILQHYNKFAEGGYVREKNNNPIAFDEEGNLTDLVTGEKGTMMLPNFNVYGSKEVADMVALRRLNNLINLSEINPFTGETRVIGLERTYPELELLGGISPLKNLLKNIKPNKISSFNISLSEALADKNYDFSNTGIARSWWDIMSKKQPEIAKTKWNLLLTISQLDNSVLNPVRDIYNSNWYKLRLLNSNINPEEVLPIFEENLNNTKILLKTPGQGFGMEAIGKNTTTKIGDKISNTISISPNIKDDLLKEIIEHEGMHASSGTGTRLPKQINNNDYILIPNFSRELNPSWYDYMSVPDELRVRLLRLANYVENNGGDYNTVIRNYKRDNYKFGKQIDEDFKSLFSSFNTDDIIRAAKNIKTTTPIIMGGATYLNQRNKNK